MHATENSLRHVRDTLESRRHSPRVVTSVLLVFPLTVVGIVALVNIGAVSIVAAQICAVHGIVVFRFILRASRQLGSPAGGDPA